MTMEIGVKDCDLEIRRRRKIKSIGYEWNKIVHQWRSHEAIKGYEGLAYGGDSKGVKVKGDGDELGTSGRVQWRKRQRLRGRNADMESTRRKNEKCAFDLGRNGLSYGPNFKWLQNNQLGLFFKVHNGPLIKLKMDLWYENLADSNGELFVGLKISWGRLQDDANYIWDPGSRCLLGLRNVTIWIYLSNYIFNIIVS